MVRPLHYVTHPGQLGEQVADGAGRMLKRLGQFGRGHLAWVAAEMVDNEIPQLPTSQPDLVTTRVVLLGEVPPLSPLARCHRSGNGAPPSLPPALRITWPSRSRSASTLLAVDGEIPSASATSATVALDSDDPHKSDVGRRMRRGGSGVARQAGRPRPP